MAKTVAQVFGMDNVKAVAPQKRTMDLIVPRTNVINSEQLLGIEVEVENYNGQVSWLDHCWNSHNDGSLRNNGIEFVTRVVAAHSAPCLLQNLMEEVLNKDCCFSPRTSIHVHFNMLPYSVDQVKNMVMLYTCFEPLFFRFIGRGRQKNIYCVPLIDTTMLQSFERVSLRDVAGRWVKYSSLNLLPLTTQGTIEARHMHGTFDTTKLCIWIRLWCKLIDYCLKQEITTVRKMIAGFDARTDYGTVLHNIFGNDIEYVKFREYPDIEKSIGVVKTCFVSPQTTTIILGDRNLEKADYFLFKAK